MDILTVEWGSDLMFIDNLLCPTHSKVLDLYFHFHQRATLRSRLLFPPLKIRKTKLMNIAYPRRYHQLASQSKLRQLCLASAPMSYPL